MKKRKDIIILIFIIIQLYKIYIEILILILYLMMLYIYNSIVLFSISNINTILLHLFFMKSDQGEDKSSSGSESWGQGTTTTESSQGETDTYSKDDQIGNRKFNIEVRDILKDKNVDIQSNPDNDIKFWGTIKKELQNSYKDKDSIPDCLMIIDSGNRGNTGFTLNIFFDKNKQDYIQYNRNEGRRYLRDDYLVRYINIDNYRILREFDEPNFIYFRSTMHDEQERNLNILLLYIPSGSISIFQYLYKYRENIKDIYILYPNYCIILLLLLHYILIFIFILYIVL